MGADASKDTGQVALGPLADDVFFLTRALMAHMRAQSETLYDQADVRPGEIVLLTLIGCNPGISQNDLAGAVVIKKSAVTKLVSDMEQRGLISRKKNKGDRRFNAITLTPAGEAKCAVLQRNMKTHQENLLQPLTKAEHRTLCKLILKLTAHLGQPG